MINELYHQCGHNYVWNIESLMEDRVGHGLIVSPVNNDADKIPDRIPPEVRHVSWFDPQFYLPHDSKGRLESYPFFPANYLEGFETRAYEERALDVALECLRFQEELGFGYLVIPTRYREELPEDHLEQLENAFVEPFLDARRQVNREKPVLLTVIARPIQVAEGPARDDLLSWITGFREIEGVYLIFDNSFQSKQIQDPGYLANAMSFIGALRDNDLEVHVGYSGIEGLVYSLADVSSVSVGSYENLRRFEIQRLQTMEKDTKRAPTPRIYSGRLFEWMSVNVMPPIRKMVNDWESLFDYSPYLAFLLYTPQDKRLSFQSPQLYKHYFWVFSRQVEELPVGKDRSNFLKEKAHEALAFFKQVGDSGVVLSPDSDGAHLYAWLNAIRMYEADH